MLDLFLCRLCGGVERGMGISTSDVGLQSTRSVINIVGAFFQGERSTSLRTAPSCMNCRAKRRHRPWTVSQAACGWGMCHCSWTQDPVNASCCRRIRLSWSRTHQHVYVQWKMSPLRYRGSGVRWSRLKGVNRLQHVHVFSSSALSLSSSNMSETKAIVDRNKASIYKNTHVSAADNMSPTQQSRGIGHTSEEAMIRMRYCVFREGKLVGIPIERSAGTSAKYRGSYLLII